MTNKTKLYIDRDNKADGEVMLNPADSSMLLIKNLSNDEWAAETPSGKSKIVKPQEMLPVKNGIKITFNNLAKGEIVKA